MMTKEVIQGKCVASLTRSCLKNRLQNNSTMITFDGFLSNLPQEKGKRTFKVR